MQSLQITFAALLLAHLLGDFLLQTSRIAQGKDKRVRLLALHGGIHFILAWATLLIFTQVAAVSLYNQLVMAVYVLLHLLIDKLKGELLKRHVLRANGTTFLLDQALHIATLTIAVLFLTRTSLSALAAGLVIPVSVRIHVLQIAIVYVGVVFGGGYFIRFFTKSLANKGTTEAQGYTNNAGLYIGWLERSLVIIAVVIRSPALVGLILTAKSIARFPEFKESRFAEYYLIGTLLSMLFALLGGLLLLQLLYGSVLLQS